MNPKTSKGAGGGRISGAYEQLYELLHEATPDPKTVLWNDAGHGLNQQAVIDRYNWLHEEIGLDPL